MTGQGGWPMTVVCTPDGKPFFAGTYFPKERRGGTIGFVELCERIDELWQTRRGELDEQADQLTEALGRSALVRPADGLPTVAELDGAVRGPRGGVGPAVGRARRRAEVPAGRWPRRPWRRPPPGATSAALAALVTSLDAMAAGGIYDHLGGGFSRYSVDGEWLVPHFEKMLYDNALLTRLYLHGWLLTGRGPLPPGPGRDDRLRAPRPAPTAAAASPRPRTPTARARRASSTSGPTPRSARCSGRRRRRRRSAWYGVPARRQLRARHHHRSTACTRGASCDGRPRSRQPAGRSSTAAPPGSAPGSTTRSSPSGTPTRSPRWPRPAPPRTSRPGSRPPSETAEFLLAHLRRSDGRWLRSWQADAGARHLAYATDHAALVDAFTRLAEATGEARWLDEARTTADALLDLFWDEEHGGVFTSGRDADALIARPKDLMDNATPGANGLAAVGLLRLAALTGDERLRSHGEAVVRLLGHMAVQHPDRVRPRAGRGRPRRAGHDGGRGGRRPPRPARGRPDAASSPTPSWPGASATTAPCGRAVRTAAPTSAGATPASSRRPPRTSSPPSSPSSAERAWIGDRFGCRPTRVRVGSGLRADPNDDLAGVLAEEHGVEGLGGGGEALEDVGAVL